MVSSGSVGRFVRIGLALLLVTGVAAPRVVAAQDDTSGKHGRKYKSPPETAHIEVLVLKGFNKKPIMNAAVIFHPIDANGKDEGTLEVKSGPDGKASIDVIPIGSQVRVQVLAGGFATYAQDFTIDTGSREITVSMVRPQAQISAYEDNQGKSSQTQPGIQVPVRTKKDGASSGAANDGKSAGSGQGTTPPAESSKPQE